jgi:hypothetical protein
MLLTSSYPSSTTEWTATVTLANTLTNNKTMTLTTYAICSE